MISVSAVPKATTDSWPTSTGQASFRMRAVS
jgi:hypothetical protein